MSTDGSRSIVAPGTAWRMWSIREAVSMAARLRAHPLLVDLALQLNDAVDERLGTRGASRHEDVDRHDLINALNNGIVVEHAAAARTGAHRDHPLGLGHLVVNPAQYRRH